MRQAKSEFFRKYTIVAENNVAVETVDVMLNQSKRQFCPRRSVSIADTPYTQNIHIQRDKERETSIQRETQTGPSQGQKNYVAGAAVCHWKQRKSKLSIKRVKRSNDTVLWRCRGIGDGERARETDSERDERVTERGRQGPWEQYRIRRGEWQSGKARHTFLMWTGYW